MTLQVFSSLKRAIVNNGKLIVGFILVVVVALLWIIGGSVMQFIYTSDFEKPFFVTYLSMSLFNIYSIGFILSPSWRNLEFDEISKEEVTSEDVKEDSPLLEYVAENIQNSFDESRNKNITEKLPLKKVILICIPYTCLWFISNYLFNISLSKTSVSSTQIISTTNTFWTLLFCHVLKIERFNLKNFLAVIITFIGAVIVSVADMNKGFGTTLGNILAALSAAFYGAYTTFLRYKIKNESEANMIMFYGLVGFVNMILFWPLFIILHYTKLEIFELPPLKILGFLILNALLATVLSDLLWSLSLLLTSPLVAAFSIGLSVPFAMIADLILKKKRFHALYIVGSIIVFVGFILVSIFRYKASQIVKT